MIEDKILNILPEDISPLATIGDLPSTKSNAVGVIAYDGNTNAEYFGKRDGSTIYQPVVKVVVRHESYETGSTWIKQVKDALHRYHDDEIMSILLVGFSMYLGKSEQKLHMFQATFTISLKE